MDPEIRELLERCRFHLECSMYPLSGLIDPKTTQRLLKDLGDALEGQPIEKVAMERPESKGC